MQHTLEQLIEVCRTALKTHIGYNGHAQILSYLQKALADPTFLDSCFSKVDWSGRKVIYQDPELGFCICAHINHDRLETKPHDHGHTWAIYGQAAGETEMSDWKMVEPPQERRPGRVKRERTYHLKQGDAYLYRIGDIHSPIRSPGTRLIRIEGTDMEKMLRTPFEVINSKI